MKAKYLFLKLKDLSARNLDPLPTLDDLYQMNVRQILKFRRERKKTKVYRA